jgi:hypothetical protein
MLASMSKSFSLAAIADIVVAILDWRSGRVVMPIILVTAVMSCVMGVLGVLSRFS